LVRRSSRTSRSSALTRSRSLVVTPSRTPESRSAWRTHFRSVSGVHPSFSATDAIAAHPTRDPHDPADLVATVYHLLGVPPATTIRDQLGRPHALVTGKPIDALLA